MLTDETTPPTYFLFDHSYAGGSWNGALIRQADAQRKRAETAEAECDRLKRLCDALGGVKDRLLPLSDALFALRRHTYACEDCGDGEPCEVADTLWTAAITACDSVYGRPEEWDDPAEVKMTPEYEAMKEDIE